MYRVITIGVNGTGPNRLSFAEKDAFDVFRTMTSPLGPPDTYATCLRGHAATRSEVVAHLQACAITPPDHLFLSVSCHGDAGGLMLHDGRLPFALLARLLRAIPAKGIVLVVDACGAGGFLKYAGEARFGVEGLPEESWAEALANAVPGLRVYAASSAMAKAREGNGVTNGHFTRALIETLFCADGELWAHPFRFVSEREAFVGVVGYMARRWPRDAAPMAYGTDGGTFPMFQSQVHVPVGRARIARFHLGARPIADVAITIRDRKHLPTFIRCALVDRYDITLAACCKRVEPGWDSTLFRHVFEFDWSAIAANPFLEVEFDAGYAIDVTWLVTVEDQRGRVLASDARSTTWWRRVA